MKRLIPIMNFNATKDFKMTLDNLSKSGLATQAQFLIDCGYHAAIKAGNYILVRKNSNCGVIDLDCNIIIDCKYITVIAPIECSHDIFALKGSKGDWSLFEIGGDSHGTRYSHIYGFDHDYAVVSTSSAFKDKGIINTDGDIIVPIGKFDNIWDFYGKPIKYDIICEKGVDKLHFSRTNPTVLIRVEENIE